jgi:hypothetical protein
MFHRENHNHHILFIKTYFVVDNFVRGRFSQCKNVLITPVFSDRLYVKLSQFKICWEVVRAQYVKMAQKASLFGL